MPELSFDQLTAGLRDLDPRPRSPRPRCRRTADLARALASPPGFTRAAVGRSSDGTASIDWPKGARFAPQPGETMLVLDASRWRPATEISRAWSWSTAASRSANLSQWAGHSL
jgi:hypothetical protein